MTRYRKELLEKFEGGIRAEFAQAMGKAIVDPVVILVDVSDPFGRNLLKEVSSRVSKDVLDQIVGSFIGSMPRQIAISFLRNNQFCTAADAISVDPPSGRFHIVVLAEGAETCATLSAASE